VLTDGLPAVEAACAEAFANGVHSADVVLNILARRRHKPIQVWCCGGLRIRTERFPPV
jgi:hypothetical protein